MHAACSSLPPVPVTLELREADVYMVEKDDLPPALLFLCTASVCSSAVLLVVQFAASDACHSGVT
jgi:hypothetical protein